MPKPVLTRQKTIPPIVLDDNRLYTQAEVCQYLGITEWTCRRRMKNGTLPHRKDGAWLRFTAADLRTYLARVGQGQPQPVTAVTADTESREGQPRA
jgi:excisionase family DNA binding protein